MELEFMPADFASAYSPLTATFVDVDPTAVTEIAVVGGQTMSELGCKRFKGSDTVAMNFSNYVARNLAPRPFYDAQTKFSLPAGRTVEAYLSWDDDSSDVRLYTASLSHHSRCDILRSDLLPRTIERHRWDELSFAVDRNDTIVASITLRDGFATVVTILKTQCAKGIYTLLVNADHLIAASPRPNAVTGFDMRFGVSNILVGTASYTLVPQRLHTLRLCWLNRVGGYDYHTFNLLSRKVTTPSRKSFVGIDGESVAFAESVVETILVSESLPPEKLTTLSAVVSSPQVWEVGDDNTFTPVTVVDSSAEIGNRNSASVVGLTLHSAKSIAAQRL